ncbi:MAG: tRNA-uridine aminocarboxypropyltransferase [Myxococcaceae bacterium]
MDTPREICRRCRRPASVCYCSELASIASRTRVVFLQHPRERTVAIGTCRMAHLALPNSELHVGVSFDDEARVKALASAPRGQTVVLFPGEGAVDAGALKEPPRNLVVIDGTWVQAKKVLERNALLRALPRIGFTPSQPGNYRIRSEPAPHCVSTIEAVVEVLGRLEGDAGRFRPMLKPFERMVDLQLERHAARTGPPRTRRKRHREARVPAVPVELTSRPGDLVLVYAEANAHGPASDIGGPAELVHLVAQRYSTGDRYEAVIAPRRPLAPSAPRHVDISAEALLAGEAVASAMGRFAAFVREGDLYCGWGRYAVDLLVAEGGPNRPLIDVRLATARVLRRRAGGIEAAVEALDAGVVEPWAQGRSGRRLAGLARLLERLIAQ